MARSHVNFKSKVINQTNARANHAADKTISKGLDAVEEGITDAVTGEGDEAKEQKENPSSDGNAQSDSDGKSDAQLQARAPHRSSRNCNHIQSMILFLVKR